MCFGEEGKTKKRSNNNNNNTKISMKEEKEEDKETGGSSFGDQISSSEHNDNDNDEANKSNIVIDENDKKEQKKKKDENHNNNISSFFLGSFFGLDVRSLAISRIFISYLILRDVCHDRLHLFSRVENKEGVNEFDFFYTEEGALPQRLIKDREDHEYWSIFYCSPSKIWAQICFGVLILSSLSYLVGYYTRTSNVITWMMVSSLQVRTQMLNQGGDLVLKVLLFWSMFVPMGDALSVDKCIIEKHFGKMERERPVKSKCKTERKSKTTFVVVSNGGSFAFISQIAIVYFFSAIYKDHPIWKNGEAVHYTLQLSKFVRSPNLAQFVVDNEMLWKNFTLLTYYWEYYGPILLIVSCCSSSKYLNKFRTFVCIKFILMHCGFHLFMHLGLFPHFCIAYWIAVLPGSFWENNKVFGWKINEEDEGANNDGKEEKIDNDDNDEDSLPPCKTLFKEIPPTEPVTSNSKQEELLEKKQEELSSLLRKLCAVYDWLFEYVIGTVFVQNVLPLFLLLCVVISWNVSDLPKANDIVEKYSILKLEDWQRTIARLSRLDQRWNMFSPYPDNQDGWFLLSGQFVRDEENADDDSDDDWNVTQHDLWNGPNGFLSISEDFPVMWATQEERKTWNITYKTQWPDASPNEDGEEDEVTKRVFMLSRKRYNNVRTEEPITISEILKNHRWDKYVDNLWMKDNIDMRRPFAGAICRLYNRRITEWNKNRPNPTVVKAKKVLSTFYFTFMKQTVQNDKPNTPKSEVEPFLLWHHYCFDDHYDIIEPRLPMGNSPLSSAYSKLKLDQHERFVQKRRRITNNNEEDDRHDEL